MQGPAEVPGAAPEFAPEFGLDELIHPDYGMPPMAHDGEAGGSGAQPEFGTDLATSIFGTPPPVSMPESDWDTADRMYRKADERVVTPRDRAWPQRANAGVPAERWSPSPWRH